jgi:hypothetical protein
VVGDLGSRRPRPAPCLPRPAARASRYEASARSRQSRLAVADDVAAAADHGPRSPLQLRYDRRCDCVRNCSRILRILSRDAQQPALRARGSLLAGRLASASASGLPEISSEIVPPPSDRDVCGPPAPLCALPRWAANLRRRRPPCVKLLHSLIKSFAPWLAAAGCSSARGFAPALSVSGLVRAGPPPRRFAGIHNFHNPQFDPRPAALHHSVPCTDTKCSWTTTLPALTSALQAMRDRGAETVCSSPRHPHAGTRQFCKCPGTPYSAILEDHLGACFKHVCPLLSLPLSAE